jgi:hypothetical protein
MLGGLPDPTGMLGGGLPDPTSLLGSLPVPPIANTTPGSVAGIVTSSLCP